MTQVWLGMVTGLVSCGAAGAGSLFRMQKKKEAGKAPVWQTALTVGGFALLFALTLAGCIFFPAEQMLRQAEQMAVLAAVLYCTVTDMRERVIPNGAVLILLAGILAFAAAQVLLAEDGGWRFWLDRLAGFFLAFAVPGLSGLLVKDGIGGGDIKLLAVLGFSYGLSGIVTVMFLAFLPCALCSIVLLGTKRGTKRTTLPLGPFLALGCLAYTVLLWV